jgi:hypothetical protein
VKRIVSIMLVVLLGFSAFAAGCGPKKEAAPATPFTTDYQQDERTVESFVANDTLETAMCAGPLYPGSRMLPAQNTLEYDRARAAKVKALVADAVALGAACQAAQPAMSRLRADYVTYLDALQKADPESGEFAASTSQALVTNTLQQAVKQAELVALVNPGAKPNKAFTRSFMDYLAVVKSADLAGAYLADLDQITGFAAIALARYADNPKMADANAAFDAAMEQDSAAAAKALAPVAEKVAAVDDGLKRISSADHYFALEAVGYMDSEVAKLKPVVDGLKPRDGLTAQDVADIKALYEGYAWWAGELKRIVASEAATDLVQAEKPRTGYNPFGVEAAYAAEGYTPGADYGKAVAVLQEAPKPAASQGWASKGGGAIKSAFGAAKTGIGVAIDSAGAAVQGVTAVGAGWYYGNSTSEIIGHIKGAGQEVADNYNKGISGAKTIKVAGEYIEGVESGAGDAAGKAVAGVLTWGANKAGVSADTQKTISSWSNWAANGITKTTVGMFTGVAKGIYKVGSTGSSTADVVSGIIDIGLGAIGGSKIIIKASQVPGLTKGAYEGMKGLGQAMLNLGRSAATASERKGLEASLRAALTSKGLTKEAVDKLISDSIKLEIAEQTAKALAATRAQVLKNLRDLIASGGSKWWGDLKGTIASSWSDLVSKSFAKSGQGMLDAGTTVMGGTLTDYIENLVAAGITDAVLTDLVNQALAVAPDPEQIDGTYKGSMTVVKVDIPEGQEKAAKEGNCAMIFKQLEGKKLPLTLKISATGGTVQMTGKSGGGSGSCEYSNGTITMKVSSEGSTITMTGKAKLRKEGGVEMSGTFVLPYKGTPIKMTGTWTASKGGD